MQSDGFRNASTTRSHDNINSSDPVTVPSIISRWNWNSLGDESSRFPETAHVGSKQEFPPSPMAERARDACGIFLTNEKDERFGRPRPLESGINARVSLEVGRSNF
ncbi:hypothetical protein QQF64_003510 [Cirrhinus molitorella]|uniref:Uncharacterized protein n=1 Tax=Cirrhinus molitorella TaxID=172907 RepID=A0ABR3MLI1_9TELE